MNMEVGAVKQAFNNEVILLKKKLNQAKIHTIHKLTRKAKTLTQKKSPEHLKEKLKRKAEAAVNEVLIIKKIKARDIAKFIITHTGEVKDYLNRPKVDNDKACARLVQHKSLQDKYNFIRNRFGNVPIKDLFMSRQERRKLKKEARDDQKNKKKGKGNKVVNAAGDWNVENVKMNEGEDDIKNDSDEEGIDDDSEHLKIEDKESGDENDSEVENQNEIENSSDEHEGNEFSFKSNSDDEAIENNDNHVAGDSDYNENEDEEAEVGKYVRLKPANEIKDHIKQTKPAKNKNQTNQNQIEVPKIDTLKLGQKQIEKKLKEGRHDRKENKNKNLKEKLQNRKFKKEEEDTHIVGEKVVDPFFKTATGENYMSLAEPRKPDEVKEVHRQGNRQERRAAIFGHEVKFKPRRDRQDNFRSNKFDREHGFNSRNSGGGFRNDRFNNSFDSNDRNTRFNDRNTKFNDRNAKFNDSNAKFNDRNFNNNTNDEKKDEKLHPSWEAKRKLKAAMALLPAHGKKIVFDDKN